MPTTEGQINAAEDKFKAAEDKVNAVLATTQTLFTVLRDVFLVILFVALLWFPIKLNKHLKDAGIQEIDGGIFKWQQQVEQAANQSKTAAQDSSAATEPLQQVKSVLVSIASESKDPNIRKRASDAASQMESSLASLNIASSSLAKSLVTQDSILQNASAATASASSPAPSLSQGWVYLGEADIAHQHWRTPPEPKISSPTPALTSGQVVTFSDDVYLRGDKAPGQTFNQAAVLGAVRSGSKARIVELQYSHALNGGEFVWVKVDEILNP